MLSPDCASKVGPDTRCPLLRSPQSSMGTTRSVGILIVNDGWRFTTGTVSKHGTVSPATWRQWSLSSATSIRNNPALQEHCALSLSLPSLKMVHLRRSPDEKKSPTTSVLKPNITESCTASKSPQKRHLLHQNTAVLHPNALSSNETTRLHWRPAAPPSGSADGRAGTARVGGLRAQRSLLLIDGLLEVLKVVVGGRFRPVTWVVEEGDGVTKCPNSIAKSI